MVDVFLHFLQSSCGTTPLLTSCVSSLDPYHPQICQSCFLFCMLKDEFSFGICQPNGDLFEYNAPMDCCGAQVVERILFVFAKLNKGIGYVQGMNEILVPIYHVMAFDKHRQNVGMEVSRSWHIDACSHVLIKWHGSDSVYHANFRR